MQPESCNRPAQQGAGHQCSSNPARCSNYQGTRSVVSTIPAHCTGSRGSNTTTGSNLQNKLLVCKKSSLIATFNVRTLNSANQLPELVASAMKLNINVICIQEHRFFHDDVNIKHQDVGNGWIFYSASAWKTTGGATIGGVGMLLSPKAANALNNIEAVDPRIVIATFQGNPAATVISCYSPTNVRDVTEVEDFYVSLSSLVRHIPKHNFIVIGGDMNAQIGRCDTHKFSYYATANRNGRLLEDFIAENDLLCLTTKFQKPHSKQWTVTYPNGVKGQIDHIIINKKWKNSAINCQAYNSFEGVYSDHRIVTTSLRLSLRGNKKKQASSPRYDWSTLASNPDIQARYSVAVRNKYDSLQSEIEAPSNDASYCHFIAAHEEASKKILPLKPKRERCILWESDVIKAKQAILKQKSEMKNKNPSAAASLEVKEAIAQLKIAYEETNQEYVQNKINEIKQAADNKQTALAWKIVNEISGRKSSNRGRLKATSQEDRLDKWKTHFKNLLGNAPEVSDKPIEQITDGILDINCGHFTHNELDVVLKKLATGKATPLDNIPPEVWKTRKFDDILLALCNGVYDGNSIISWGEGCILPFPKKGDLGLTDNYRGITLTAIASKIYNSLLRNRIQPHIEPILRKNQNGFRRERSTVGQILTVRRIIEGVRAKNLPACLLFVDFSKAFDSIHRGKMEQILLAYGIPNETVSAIMMLYRNTKSKVRSPDGDTDFFDIKAGVLQGDTLAPFLFIIVLDYVLRTSLDKNKDLGFTLAERLSSRHPAEKLTDIDYADDLALSADIIKNAEKLLHSLEESANDVGLFVNAKKTEYMDYNQQQRDTIKTKAGKILKPVNSFVYLGSQISATKKDFEINRAKAWTALNGFDSIWKSNLPDNLKKDFFRATVEFILLYGATAWTLTKTLESKLDGTYTRMLRAVLNISWRQHPTIAQLYGELPKITEILRERRMKFAGHCWRAKQELASDLLLWTPKHGERTVGQPAKTYIDQLIEDSCCHRGEIEQLKIQMNDRTVWRDNSKVRARSNR